MTQHIIGILLFCLSVATAYSQVPPDIQAFRLEPPGDYSSVRQGALDFNSVRTYYYNTSQIGRWPSTPGAEWPRGSGHLYVEEASILLGAKISLPGGVVITPIEGHCRSWYDFDPVLGSQYGWDLEPVPGYAAQSGLIPAISNAPQSWPASWNNKWHGMDGTDSLHGELETYFVVDDSKDAEFSRPPYGFFPIPSDSSRKGLGLRVEVRGLQWNTDTLARDMIFFIYDVINLSDCDYDTAAFGLLFVPGVGSYQNVKPNQTVSFSPGEDMVSATATDGLGLPDNWRTGQVGVVLLETPAKGASDTNSAGIRSFSTHSQTDHGLTGFVLQNDTTLWEKMTSGFSDTTYNNALVTALIGAGTFPMPKWSRQRFAVAYVFANTQDSLSVKAAHARRIAAAGYYTGRVTSVLTPGISGNSPTVVSLAQNFPNPFNPSTTITYELPRSSEVKLSVYDMLGREISVLVNGRTDAGIHEVRFDGSGLASGVYLYRLTASGYVQTRKFLLLR